MGNISYYNRSGCTGCHLVASCCVFVGHDGCFWESDGEQAKGLFPSVRSLLQRVQLIDHCALGGRTNSVGGMGKHNRDMYNMDVRSLHTSSMLYPVTYESSTSFMCAQASHTLTHTQFIGLDEEESNKT